MIDDLTIRMLGPGEERQVQTIARSLSKFLGPPPARSWTTAENTMVAVRANGYVIGYCYFSILATRDEVVVAQIATHPMFRKHGIARSLLRELAESAERTTVALKVEADNPAVLFYLRLGFTEVGRSRARTGRAMVEMKCPSETLRR